MNWMDWVMIGIIFLFAFVFIGLAAEVCLNHFKNKKKRSE